jgi:hypothetical protein
MEPNARIMKAYGTEDVYQQKLADGAGSKLPLAAGIAASVLGFGLLQMGSSDIEAKKLEAQRDIELLRAQEAARNAGDVQNLRGGRGYVAPYASPNETVLAPGAFQDFNLRGIEKGGAAAVAVEIGRGMAKEAIIGKALGAIGGAVKKVVSPVVKKLPIVGRGGWKGQAAGLGIAGLGGYGLYKGVTGGAAAMASPTRVKTGPKAAAPPRYVNPWGQPVR